MIKTYKIILVLQLLTVCISKSSNSIIDISFAPGAVNDSFNIRWKERSLNSKGYKCSLYSNFYYVTKIHIFFFWSYIELWHIRHYPCCNSGSNKLQWNKGCWGVGWGVCGEVCIRPEWLGHWLLRSSYRDCICASFLPKMNRNEVPEATYC